MQQTTSDHTAIPWALDELLDIGTHQLHVRVTPATDSGLPPIVFEHGHGSAGATLGPVIRRLRGQAQVLVYDRAGTGRSERGPTPRTGERIAADLDAILTALEARGVLAGPYVLTGHSIGAIHIRMFADRSPERVAGLAFLDPTVEGLLEGARASMRPLHRVLVANDAIPLLRMGGLFARSGLMARAIRQRQRDPRRALPPEIAEAMLARTHSRYATHAQIDEMRQIQPTIDTVAALPIPNVPTTVVTGLKTGGRETERSAQIKLSRHAWLADRFADAEHIVLDDVGHNVHVLAPDAAADALARLCQRAGHWDR